jgi:hypothetical protein
MIYNRSLKDPYQELIINKSRFIPFLLGRNAINYLIKTLEIKAILLPTYICSIVVDIFNKYDVEVFFYENLDQKLKIPSDQIISSIKNVNSNNKLFFLWHDYLNIIGDLPDELRDFLQESDIEVLIDATHSIPTKLYKSKYVIYGFRKLLNQPFGSLLYLDENKSSKSIIELSQMKLLKFLIFHKISSNIFLLLKSHNNRIIDSFLKGISKFGDRLSFEKNNFFLFDQFNYSKILNLHKNLDYEEISRARNENFLKYLSLLKNTIDINNFDLSCPYGFPLLVKNNKVVRKKLWSMGVHSFILWSDLHKDVPSKLSKNSKFLSNANLILPVNQDLTFNDIERISNIINE